MNDPSTTLVAPATPPGRGGVGCLRLSGERAVEIALRLFRPGDGVRPEPGGRPVFGRLLARDGRPLDHGYVVLFARGASFTGEQSAELWPHGSPVVLAELVAGAVAAGATPAGPGEFTYRALCNGRLDLARAEAIRDLVAARTLYQARVAFVQVEGAVARRVEPLREQLEEWIARCEAAVEFVDESETHLPAGTLRQAIERARLSCTELLRGFRTGRIVRDGATLVVVGLPNAGKSSLFNRLLERERAIVTESAGTTRDTVEEQLDLSGIPVTLIDTAGLREARDPAESEGVRRARLAREEADLVLLVLDGSRPLEPDEHAALERAAGESERARTVVVLNKCDLPPVEQSLPDALPVSALTGEGLEQLRAELHACLVGAGPVEDPIVTDARHADALSRTDVALERAARAADDGLSEELLLEDLKLAMHHLGEIVGEMGNEELYDRIFSTFCIGK